MGTRRYIASKVLQALLTLAFVMVFNFFLFRVIPGDPAALLLRGTAAFNPQNVAAGDARSSAWTSPCRNSSSSTPRTP